MQHHLDEALARMGLEIDIDDLSVSYVLGTVIMSLIDRIEALETRDKTDILVPTVDGKVFRINNNANLPSRIAWTEIKGFD